MRGEQHRSAAEVGGRPPKSRILTRVCSWLIPLQLIGLLICIVVFEPLSEIVSSCFIFSITLTVLMRILIPFIACFGTKYKEDGALNSKRLAQERDRAEDFGTVVLESDPARRRQYLKFPRRLFLLGCPGLLALAFLGLYLTKPQMHDGNIQLLRQMLLAVGAMGMLSFLPLLIYWANCAGTSLVQRIYLPSQGGLHYTGYSGSMEQREEFSFTLMTLASFSVSKRSLRMRGWFYKETRDIHGSRAKEVYKSLWIPRTFSEDREQELIKALEAMGDRPAAIASSGRHSGDSDSE